MNRDAIGSQAGSDENASSAAFGSDIRVALPFDFDGLAPWLRLTPHPPRHHPRRAATHLCVNHLAPLPKMLLVDEDALVRAGLRMILSSAEDLEVDTPNSLEQQLS